MAEIRIQNLQKRFADFTAVKNSSLVLEDGKFVVLLGPSGCGKTTTLRMIAGLEFPTGGTITLDGSDVTYRRPRERDIAMVFQLFALYPHMGVRDNLEFPLRNEGVPRAEIDRRINEVAGILRIEHLLGSRVGGLAGGDRQRVALGRAIVREPKAFLMDEPLGTLDAEFRELMCVELRKLHERLKTTTVFVTHDQNEAMALADHIVVMNNGEILQADDPHGIYNFPSCVFVARFIGRPPMNLLQVRGTVAGGDSQVQVDGRLVDVPALQGDADRALLGVRPEHVRLVPSGEGLGGHVERIEYFGSHWIAELKTEAGTLKALVDKHTRPVEGERVGLAFDTSRLVLFDAVTERLLPSATTTAHRPSMRHG
ncbi:ABC transporter ATP-binding protein [Aquincola sp. S2]|uniref:ABC transporter ATP-binding protein n=1 Tax=Pseudaquabacterium terrae TaxID=2732868 RepID=A0ABX2EFU2_9BURK|nr:ABC transporter ATP-binding protein [Aquabacterium terrae]NRF67456.1 ABC transporter ATP-binding protein [Aquabacterium terrae]